MRDHMDDHSKSMMSRVMNVSRSGFNKWLKRPESARAQRKAQVTRKVLETYEAFEVIYGAPRIKQELTMLACLVQRILWLKSWRRTAYALAMVKASNTLGTV